MQPMLLLALILLCAAGDKGRGGGEELFGSGAMEFLKEITEGDGQAEAFIKEVEEISKAVSAFAPSAKETAPDGGKTCGGTAGGGQVCIEEVLKPVADIADDRIYNALARAVRE